MFKHYCCRHANNTRKLTDSRTSMENMLHEILWCFPGRDAFVCWDVQMKRSSFLYTNPWFLPKRVSLFQSIWEQVRGRLHRELHVGVLGQLGSWTYFEWLGTRSRSLYPFKATRCNQLIVSFWRVITVPTADVSWGNWKSKERTLRKQGLESSFAAPHVSVVPRLWGKSIVFVDNRQQSRTFGVS